jgi:rubrerythrin
MVISEGVAALKSLKSLYEIARDVRNSTDPEKLRIAAAQMFDLAMAAREQTAALEEQRNEAMANLARLESEIRTFKSWEVEKLRYELKSVWHGAMVYALKTDKRNGEPAHWLCANCYTQGKKSFLNSIGTMGGVNIWVCPNCSAKCRISSGIAPT